MLVSIICSMVWEMISLVLAIVFVILSSRLNKRRKEICDFERILDNNGIDFQPSSMYRSHKGWKNKLKYMFSRVTRKKCNSFKQYV